MKKMCSNLTSAQVNALSKAATEMFRASGIKDEVLEIVSERIEAAVSEQTDAIKRDKTYSGLDEKDSKRDALLSDIATILKAMSVIGVAEIEAAAALLSKIFAKYGLEITKAKYDEESALIDSLHGDFGSEEAQAAIKVIPGFKAKTDALWDAEAAFKSATADFVKAEAAKKKGAYALKKELVSVFNDILVPYVSAVALVKESYKPFADELSARIERANAAAK